MAKCVFKGCHQEATTKEFCRYHYIQNRVEQKAKNHKKGVLPVEGVLKNAQDKISQEKSFDDEFYDDMLEDLDHGIDEIDAVRDYLRERRKGEN